MSPYFVFVNGRGMCPFGDQYDAVIWIIINISVTGINSSTDNGSGSSSGDSRSSRSSIDDGDNVGGSSTGLYRLFFSPDR